ncbi:hypothetical protein B0O80DRAFT_467473 [Mortierella sp. GBAus27b]|nr:hypothetical protein B0O80DRAFT_467473 [Mortierella sp. GBAus27b]
MDQPRGMDLAIRITRHLTIAVMAHAWLWRNPVFIIIHRLASLLGHLIGSLRSGSSKLQPTRVIGLDEMLGSL